MSKIWHLYKMFNQIKFIGIIISAIGILAMMFFITADVISRNFLAGSITGSFEFVTYYFMPLAVFPALGYVYSSGTLPKMDLVLKRFKTNIQNIIINILLIFELILFTFVVYYSLQYAINGMQAGRSFSAGVELYPLTPVYFLVPLGLSMIVIEILFILSRNIFEKGASFTMEKDN